jgi:hypothetical protein
MYQLMRNAVVIFLLVVAMVPTASGSWLSKTIQKPGKWIAKQSGVKPTVDNTNKTLKSIEKAVKEFGDLAQPSAVAIQSITRTSDAAGELLVTIKWPIVLAAYLCAVWLGTLAFNGFRAKVATKRNVAVEAGELRPKEQTAEVSTMPRSSAFVLIGLGSLVVFVGLFVVEVQQNPNLSLDMHLTPYLAVATMRSAILAAVLCAIVKLKRRASGVAIGMAASVVMLAFIAIVPSDLDEQEYRPVEKPPASDNGKPT